MTICKKSSPKLLLALFGLVAASFLIGCGNGGGAGTPNGTGPAPAGTTTYGAPQPLGSGTARSYVTIGSDGTPQAVGVQVSQAAVTSVGNTAFDSVHLVLPLPAQASVTPMDHIDFIYAGIGHFPPGLYDVPQFDVYFYYVTQQFRQQIQGIGADNLAKLYQVPFNDEAPPTYFLLPGSGVTDYGVHYAYFQDPEFVNKGFTDSLDLVYYDGHLIGEEPLVSLSYLQQKNIRVDTLETPKKYPHAGFWPTQNALRYDPAANAYTISLEGFVHRN